MVKAGLIIPMRHMVSIVSLLDFHLGHLGEHIRGVLDVIPASLLEHCFGPVRNYLHSSGVIISEGYRPQEHSMIPVAASRRPTIPAVPHHHEPQALVGQLRSSNGKNTKRLSLIFKGDPNDILRSSRKSPASPTPSSAATASPSPIGVGKFKHEQLKHLASICHTKPEKKNLWNDGREMKKAHQASEEQSTLDRIKTFGIGYG